ncbi:MAG TPA: Rieske 2Fe-2S domain-containing protein [Gaiellaceae bacterium]|nr:Rieske 2Fe-2S domain-containing protein [Gaiellaceae bacterium]
MKHLVGTVDEIPPGSRKIVTVEGRSIGVFNVGGRFYAVRNTCPHQGASLCLGELYGALESSSPGEYRLDPSQVVVRCPWHGWEFELETGQSWWDPQKTRVRRYSVTVEGVRQKGPYVAETYPVTVEGPARVLVELD